jgi:hypothetical protein
MATELPEEFDCCIKTPNEEELKIKCKPQDTGQTLKKLTFKKYAYREYEFQLFFLDEEVDNDQTLQDLTRKEFTPESKLELVFLNPIKVVVKLIDGTKKAVL